MTDKLVPELTAEQKIQILLLQRQMLSTHLNITRAQKELEQASSTLTAVLNKIVADLNIDPNVFTFDLDTLKLAPKPATATASA